MRADKLPRIGTTIFFRHADLESVASLTWMRLGGRAGLGWQLSTPDLVIEDVPEDLARVLARFLTAGNALHFDDKQFDYGCEHLAYRGEYAAGKVHWVSNCTAQFWQIVRTTLQKAGYL